MTWEAFQTWALPALLVALAFVVWGLAGWVVRRFEKGMDRLDARIDVLVTAVNKDMRYMGERMVRVETFLKLPPLPPPQ